jgi:hypothetical protein
VITIVSWLWTNDPRHASRVAGGYRVEHVARLSRMVAANLALPHDFAVVTDRPTHEFPSDIRVIPIWDDYATMGHCWRRLKAFAPEMREIIGPRFAWIDLDCCVVGDLTPLLDRPEDAVFWSPKTTASYYNGSLVLLTAGSRARVWDTFDPERSPQLAKEAGMKGSDQAWWSYVLGPNEARWTQRDGVVSFFKDCRNQRPAGTRIVFFPGRLKANADMVRATAPWIGGTLDGYLPIDEPEYAWPPWQHAKARLEAVDELRAQHPGKPKRTFSRKVVKKQIRRSRREEAREQRQAELDAMAARRTG